MNTLETGSMQKVTGDSEWMTQKELRLIQSWNNVSRFIWVLIHLLVLNFIFTKFCPAAKCLSVSPLLPCLSFTLRAARIICNCKYPMFA